MAPELEATYWGRRPVERSLLGPDIVPLGEMLPKLAGILHISSEERQVSLCVLPSQPGRCIASKSIGHKPNKGQLQA